MSAQSYTPMITRIRILSQRLRVEIKEFHRNNPIIASTAKRLKCDPLIIIIGPLAILAAVLFLNPRQVAPKLANALALLPAIASLQHLGRPHSAAKVQQSNLLLDYWMRVGTSFVLEQLVSEKLIGHLMPIWWLVKGMVGIRMWMSIDIEGRAGNLARQGLTLNTSTARVSMDLPEPEPSPSPIGNCVSALALSARPDNWHQSNPGTGDSSGKYTLNANGRDSPRPPNLSESDGPDSPFGFLPIPTTQQPISTPHPYSMASAPPTSPRDHLHALLDATASHSPTARKIGFSPAQTLKRADTLQHWPDASETSHDGDGSSDDVSPTAIIHSLLPDSAPLTRLPGHAEALNGGPQMKDKGGDRGESQPLTLDDLLDMEYGDHQT